MDNQQLQDLNNRQLQVLLTGKFGDGHLSVPKNINSNSNYSTNCIHKEYIQFKQKLLGNLSFNITKIINNGYKKGIIYSLSTKHTSAITAIYQLDIESSLNLLDDLGIAMWFYDDGSLHKHKYFYNLNTHKFSKEIQENLFIPFFNKWGIYPKLTKEIKKDGREFWYLRISKFEGAYEISKMLQKYSVSCFNYKVWSSETIQKWSKLQVELKRKGVKVTNKKMSELLKCETTQDIVRSLEKSKAGVIPA